MQAAAALNHQLDQALTFRAPKPKSAMGPVISSDKLNDTSHALVSSDGDASSVMPGSELSLSCRLFSQVQAQNLSVRFQSEFSEVQQKQLSKASSQGRAMQHAKGTFAQLTVRQHSHCAVAIGACQYCSCRHLLKLRHTCALTSTFVYLQEKMLPGIAVDGATVQAYADLAARTAAKRTRPVSKQVNLGPRKVIRCGWGGQGPGPLESLARQQRAKDIFNSLVDGR